MNIWVILEMAADAMDDRIAVGSLDGGSTYSGLADRSRRIAAVVRSAGVRRLGLVDLNSDLVPALLFASAAAGVPLVPVSYRLAEDRLRAVAARIAPALLVADTAIAERLAGIDDLQVFDRQRLAERTSSVHVDPGAVTLAEPGEVAVELFTSGTSGAPKAARLRHRHLVAYVLSTIEFMSADPDEATLVSVPPYHIAGMAAVLSSTYAGRRLVYLPQFDPVEWVRVAEAEAVTHAMVVPTMLGRILDAIEGRGASLASLRHVSYGGGRMPVPVIERAMDILPHVGFTNAYGLTETSSTVAVLGAEDHRAARASADPAVRARLGSVGHPLPSLELEIRGADGVVVSVGTVGEIHVRGEQVAGEYEHGSTLGSDGWFATKDGGYLDHGGYLFVEGRLDDVIVRGGENLSPGEIEDVILGHPAVADVAVVGVPDEEWGEVVAAAVVCAPGRTVSEPELQDWVRERLRSSRTPALVAVRDRLPYSEVGKLLRRSVRDELATQAAARR